jgi:hypothetical protein
MNQLSGVITTVMGLEIIRMGMKEMHVQMSVDNPSLIDWDVEIQMVTVGLTHHRIG